MNDALIARLCKRHCISLFDYAIDWKEDELPSYGEEASGCTMARSNQRPPTIFLGVYKDPELRLISFFHELGHIVDVDNKLLPKYEDLPYYHFSEASAWRRGLRLSTRAGVGFSETAIAWAKGQLSTYFEDDNLERTPLQFLSEALEYGFTDERRESELISLTSG